MIFRLINILKPVRNRKQIPHRLIYSLNLWNEELSSEIKHKIEDVWKDRLKHEKFNESDVEREKYYVLSMFPYPSGYLHMGHVRVYTISDAIARFQRMNGKNVLHPIGWDAFGLPAENAAIERQVAPNDWTDRNIAHMKTQLQKLGCSFEWDREISTCDPNYYRWTQYLFVELFKNGFAYQKKSIVNWDPVDQTVLADEQVDENGCSWRSGARVEKKALKQWFIRTTRFAKDLQDGLDDEVLQDWRDVIKMQQHWIGDCNGMNFDFRLNRGQECVTVWTSTPEFIKNCKFLAITENNVLAKNSEEVHEKGTTLLSIKLINPFNQKEIPIYVTDELEFAPFTDSFLGIPGASPEAAVFANKHGIEYEPEKPLTENQINQIRLEIGAEARKLKIGGYWTSAKLRDWLISRQRFWGTPIPIIHCDTCGPQPVPDADLPVKLPNIEDFDQKGGSQLSQCTDWLNVSCPICKGAARRESDTMDTFVDSSWYYLRYCDPRNKSQIFNPEKIRNAFPVDLYIGGKEHAVLHLYYARFISHFLHFLGLVPEREPFKRLLVQGMVMGRSYRLKGSGKYVPESEVKVIDAKKNKAVEEATGEQVVMAWEKMSKSKHNGVDPDQMFREYGVDTTRLLILADVAPTSHRNWNSNTFPGILNWQKRLWLTIRDFLQHRNTLPSPISEAEFKVHDDYMFDSRNYYIKGTTFNYCGSQQHSVAISKQQGLTNSLRRVPPAVMSQSVQFERALASQIIILAPMAPHFASELWSGFVSAPNRLNTNGEIEWDKGVLEQKWPQIDWDYKMNLVCKINGEEVCVVKIPRKDLEKLIKEDAIKIATSEKSLQTELENRTVYNMRFTLYKGYEAVLSILTNITAEDREKKKNEKKLKRVKN